MVNDDTSVSAAGQVRSVQSLAVSGTHLEPNLQQVQEAGYGYFAFLDRLARPFLRVRQGPAGTMVVRLCGVTLLSFRVPAIREEAGVAAICFPIAAGLLVQQNKRCRGELRLELHPDRLVMAVEGYYPALVGSGSSRFRRWLYQRTQAAVHRRVAARYLKLWLSRAVAERGAP